MNAFVPAFPKRKSLEHEQEVRVLVKQQPPYVDGRSDWLKAKGGVFLPVDLD